MNFIRSKGVCSKLGFERFLCNRLFNNATNESHKKFQKIGLIGLGRQGHAIAFVVARAGYNVIAIESNSQNAMKGIKSTKDSLTKMIMKEIQKGKINETDGNRVISETMSRLQVSTNLTDIKDCDLIIEATTENLDIKLELYKQLGNA